MSVRDTIIFLSPLSIKDQLITDHIDLYCIREYMFCLNMLKWIFNIWESHAQLTREQMTYKESQVVTHWSPVSMSQTTRFYWLKNTLSISTNQVTQFYWLKEYTHKQTSTMSDHGNISTTEKLFGMISQLQEMIGTLEARQLIKSVKVQTSVSFDGIQSNLHHFLTQLDLCLCINQEWVILKANKILFMSTYLTGFAFDWFQPILCDYQEHMHQTQDNNTQAVFGSYQEFKKQLENTFRDIGSMQNTAEKLWWLWQTGSALWLVSEFQQLIAHLDWDEDAYMAWFEEILKSEIQKKMIWMEQSQSLSELFAWAVKIDNTLYDLRTRQRESKSGNMFRGSPWMYSYQLNNKQQMQPRSQGDMMILMGYDQWI